MMSCCVVVSARPLVFPPLPPFRSVRFHFPSFSFSFIFLGPIFLPKRFRPAYFFKGKKNVELVFFFSSRNMKRKINYLCLFVYWLLGNVRSSAHCAFLFVSRPSGFVAGVAGKHRWSHPIDFLTTLTLTPATTAQVDRETVANDKKNSIEMYENGNEEGRRTGDVAARWRNSASTSWNRKKAGRNNERKCIFFPERIQFSIDFVLSGTRIS